MKKSTALMMAVLMLFIAIFTNTNLQIYAATEKEQITVRHVSIAPWEQMSISII